MAYSFKPFVYSSPSSPINCYLPSPSSYDSDEDNLWNFNQQMSLPLPTPPFDESSWPHTTEEEFPSAPNGPAPIHSHYEGSSYEGSPTLNTHSELYPLPPPRTQRSHSWASSSHDYPSTSEYAREHIERDSQSYEHCGPMHPSLPPNRWENEAPCKPFAIKLDILLRNVDLYGDVVTWDTTGRSFIVAPTDRLSREVLPAVFSHSSISAFTRQLTTYGFFHLSTSQIYATFQQEHIALPLKDVSAWSHPHFTRDDATTLHLLTPRPSRARSLHKKMKAEALQLANGKVKESAQSRAAAALASRKAAKEGERSHRSSPVAAESG